MKDVEAAKIAIMTWYKYRNYGTALQAGAMFHTISSMGCEPYMIQYAPKEGIPLIPKMSGSFLIRKGKEYLGNLLAPHKNHWTSKEREVLFQQFQDAYIRETKAVRCVPELKILEKEFDAFICGSDQIWSPLCFDEKYFFSFIENTKKMIAYAPSVGSVKIDEPLIKEEMKRLISRFEYLSVREEQGAQLIRELTGKQAEVVLDPTLLLSADEWDAYLDLAETQKIDGDYIICYFLGDADKYDTYVRKMSKQLKVPFFVIPMTRKQFKGSHNVPFEVGPREFVSLIRNAKYVCTDSFHGTAFAVNYKIPFSVFKRFNEKDPRTQNSRIYNLLNALELEERLTKPSGDRVKHMVKEYSYEKAHQLLKVAKKKSYAYLRSSLNAVFSDKDVQMDIRYVNGLCCGCGACQTVCTTGAVRMMLNHEGFIHYETDTDKCIHCGACRNVCPMQGIEAQEIKNAVSLNSVKSNSKEVLQSSSSGGVGYELAAYLQEKGTYICGCIYDGKENKARHILISPEEKEKLSLIQGSKYIQSTTADVFKEIISVAKTDQIAFFGTPCQTAALDKLLSRYSLRQQVILVDLICHGVPSHHLWFKHIKEVDKKYKTGEHPEVQFRLKKKGWRNRTLEIKSSKYKYSRNEIKDNFYKFFRRGICDMETCYECPYREVSAADIRIGDYWGEKFEHDKDGVSMVISNTPMGEELIRDMSPKRLCAIQKHEISQYWEIQYPYNKHRPLEREIILMDLQDKNKTLKQLSKRYCRYYDFVEAVLRLEKKVKKIFKLG